MKRRARGARSRRGRHPPGADPAVRPRRGRADQPGGVPGDDVPRRLPRAPGRDALPGRAQLARRNCMPNYQKAYFAPYIASKRCTFDVVSIRIHYVQRQTVSVIIVVEASQPCIVVMFSTELRLEGIGSRCAWRVRSCPTRSDWRFAWRGGMRSCRQSDWRERLVSRLLLEFNVNPAAPFLRGRLHGKVS